MNRPHVVTTLRYRALLLPDHGRWVPAVRAEVDGRPVWDESLPGARPQSWDTAATAAARAAARAQLLGVRSSSL